MTTEKQLERQRRQRLLADLGLAAPEAGDKGMVTVGQWLEYWARVLGC